MTGLMLWWHSIDPHAATQSFYEQIDTLLNTLLRVSGFEAQASPVRAVERNLCGGARTPFKSVLARALMTCTWPAGHL